jgi:hypothetical protein
VLLALVYGFQWVGRFMGWLKATWQKEEVDSAPNIKITISALIIILILFMQQAQVWRL